MQSALFNVPPPALSVTDITRHIRQLFDVDDILTDVWLEGEISNWSPASSGHIYFTLKDSGASIRCVIWRSTVQRLRYLPQGGGEAIVAHGRVSVYEAGGSYQFYVDDIEAAGLGTLYVQFERLKRQLDDEGLFDPERKRPLPVAAKRIGVITSAKAAALQDVLNVLGRRYPLAQVFLSPAPVQGADAPPQLVAALARLTAISPPMDVILLVRGGGSIEDLWAFNDEVLARDIAHSPVPIVTGVGHETDFTIADFVADQRAPTPSAAAELVTPDIAEIRRQLEIAQVYLLEQAQTLLIDKRASLQTALQHLNQNSPQRQIENKRQQLDEALEQLTRSMTHRLSLHRAELAGFVARLAALNPNATLARGYAIVHKQGQLITKSAQVTPGDPITVTLKDGTFEAEVTPQHD